MLREYDDLGYAIQDRGAVVAQYTAIPKAARADTAASVSRHFLAEKERLRRQKGLAAALPVRRAPAPALAPQAAGAAARFAPKPLALPAPAPVLMPRRRATRPVAARKLLPAPRPRTLKPAPRPAAPGGRWVPVREAGRTVFTKARAVSLLGLVKWGYRGAQVVPVRGGYSVVRPAG